MMVNIPTSAPTEQDRERAREAIASFFGLQEFPHLADTFAAALQAERERTRAEERQMVWDEAIKIANYAAETMRQFAHKDALEAAQLPQGKDK
jgi:hypothetical protein